ncbi:hypothetical protein J6590_050472 [Homalodisca vitripennis]|nr:hypothetical protein J6590_050472 [Homalodisca vitripennis]
MLAFNRVPVSAVNTTGAASLTYGNSTVQPKIECPRPASATVPSSNWTVCISFRLEQDRREVSVTLLMTTRCGRDPVQYEWNSRFEHLVHALGRVACVRCQYVSKAEPRLMGADIELESRDRRLKTMRLRSSRRPGHKHN